MPFVKGKSGNPRGRPRGARGKKTLARAAALRAEAEAKLGRMGRPGFRLRRRGLKIRWLAAEPAAPPLAAGDPQSPGNVAEAAAAYFGADAMTVLAAAGLLGCDGDLAQDDTADEPL